METAIAVAPGVISVVLGGIGTIVSIVPVRSTAARSGIVSSMLFLSFVAIGATVLERRAAATRESAIASLLAELKRQNEEDSAFDVTMFEAVIRAAGAPERAAALATLKKEIGQHLSAVAIGLAEAKRPYESSSDPDARQRGERSATERYYRQYHERTCLLLDRAVELRLIPDRGCAWDQRFVEIGLLAGVEELEELHEFLPD